MLQQTTVAAVGPYFRRFLARWPKISDLARAELDHVLTVWQGLGYYTRARNLHRCARELVEANGGVFPRHEAELRDLPGIGAYTAAAIAAIAFDRPAVVVDGNVERVMSRFFAVEQPLPDAKPTLRALAAGLSPCRRPGDYAQALMDLGATVCTPTRPACGMCPWRFACGGYRQGNPERMPYRRPKKIGALRHATAFVLKRSGGAVLLRRRPEHGLLGGMMEVPSTPWTNSRPDAEAVARAAPAACRWRRLPSVVHHGFTHFPLDIEVMVGNIAERGAPGVDGIWSTPDRLAELALATLTKKILRHAAEQGTVQRLAGAGRRRRRPGGD